MNGVAIMLQVLGDNVAVTALVPDHTPTGGSALSRVIAGVVPLGTPLPAVSVASVSSVDRNLLAPGVTRRVTERVQVTGMAATYPAMKAIMAAVKRAGADQMPAVAGVTDVVIHTDSAGPDFMDESASIYLGTQDFRISFNELT